MNGLTRPRALGILALRVMAGATFLYAGLEKVLGAERFSAAGYLNFGTAGTAAGVEPGTIVNPTHSLWVGLATNPTAMTVIDFIVPFGQIAIGIALILGLATRFAGLMGFLMMAGFTFAGWDFAHGPLNHTVMLGIVTLVLGIISAGEVYGLDAMAQELPIVRRFAPALRYALG